MSVPVTVIERAHERDLDAIMTLEHTGFGPGSRWIGMSWLPELTTTGHFAPAARSADGALVGVAAFRSIAEVAEVNRLVVDPGHRGRGIGRALLEAGLAWAASQGGERMLLEVESTNQAALGLYRGVGFVEITSRADYYGAGRDALVMQRDIAGCGS